MFGRCRRSLLRHGAVRRRPADPARDRVRAAGRSLDQFLRSPALEHEGSRTSVHNDFSMAPSALLGILFPGMNGYTLTLTWGSTAMALATIAVMASFRILYVRLFLTLGLGGLCLALGSYTPLHGVLYSLVPMVEKARTPSMGVVILNFSFSVLCAYGIDALSHYEPRRIVAIVAAVLGAGILALTAGLRIAHQPGFDERTILVGVYALATAGVLASSLRPKIIGQILTLLALGQFSLVCAHDLKTSHGKDGLRYLRNFPESADIVDFLRTRQQPLRVDVDERAIPFNFGDWYGVEQSQGYLASVSSNLIHQELHTQRTQQLLGIRYTSDVNRNGRINRLSLRIHLPYGSSRHPGVLPRARIVRKFRQFRSEPQVVGFIAGQENDLAATAALLEPPPASSHVTARRTRYG